MWKGGQNTATVGYDLEQYNATAFSDVSDGTHTGSSNNATLMASTWTYLVSVVDRATNVLRLYQNGSEVGTAPSISTVGSITSSQNLYFGQYSSGTPWNGTLDEARLSNIARSASWIATEYTNQNNPSSFIIVGQTIPNMLNGDLPALSVTSVSGSASSGSDQLNVGARGAIFVVNASSVTTTLTLTVQGKDVTSGQYYQLASFSGLTSGVSNELILYPGVQASAQSASGILPRTWRVQIVATGGGSAGATTVGASLIN
jgi:hypothetical protein